MLKIVRSFAAATAITQPIIAYSPALKQRLLSKYVVKLRIMMSYRTFTYYIIYLMVKICTMPLIFSISDGQWSVYLLLGEPFIQMPSAPDPTSPTAFP